MTNTSNVSVVLDQISELQTHYDVFKFLKQISSYYQFDNFMVCALPRLGETIAENVIVTNWDQELVQAFDQHNIGSAGKEWAKLRSTILPVTISAQRVEKEAETTAKTEAQILDKFKFSSSVFFPLVQPDGVRWVFGFSRTSQQADVSAQEYLHLILIHLADKMRSFETNKTEQRTTLSQREKDCLKWTASGKTSGEIASILSLSEHTVNHYLMNATRKLQAVTRTQAVVNALRIGMIQ